MVKDKLVPKLRFNEFHDEWNMILLNSILSFKNGFNASKDQYGFGTKFINVSDILENNYLTYDNIQDYVNVNENELNNYIIEYGDIVFQRSSENREEVGTANVYLGSQPCVYGGFVIRGKKEGKYNPFFLKELLQSTQVRKEITSWSGGSTRYNIGQDSLNKISISLPSIEEQNKIADLLLKVYEKIDLLEYKYKCYKNFKKYLMQQIFTQKLRFDNFDDEWQTKRFDELFNISVAGDMKQEHYSETKNSTFKYPLYANALENEGLLGYYDEFKYSPNSITVTARGNIGYATLRKTKFNAIGRLIILTSKNDLNMEFFTEYINMIVKFHIESTGVPQLTAPSLKINKLYFPTLEEQNKIALISSNLNNKINFIQNEIKNLKKFKNGLLQQMFI